ncbi:MAG: protein kinase [Lachnospiraceae bacterium]|nr:protein kinase [Lachnospiraceae bacterium]
MIILEGQKDIYMPVRQISKGTGEAGIYLCENQQGEKFAARIYRDMNGICNPVRKFLYQTENPYLMKLWDHGVSEIQGNKCAYEIFEYMEQGTLASGAPLDEYYVEKTVIPCINEAINGMHEAGFLHRDIKPDNMYRAVLADGTECAKLGDFGISVALGKEKSYCDAALAFTPGYAPAEVLGTGMYSAASDYYGLAVSIYYLLTGRQIYEGLSPDEIMIKTRRGELMRYEGVSKRLAGLLEGLTVQDPRYRWGYKEVKAWLSGANVPIFRYSQEEQLLDVPYQLTANVSCSSLRELSEAICQYPEEGKKHLYDGLLSDSLRRQYQHLSNTLSDLTVNRFPHAHNAGLAAAIHLLNPASEGFFWNGRKYKGLFALLNDLRQEVAEGALYSSSEELLASRILSYYYEDILSKDDMELLKSVENEAQNHPLRAACELVVKMLPDPVYQPQKDVQVKDIISYINFLEKNQIGFTKQVYQDFNKEYFRCWLGAIGYSIAFREWREFFYKGGRIAQDERITGNVCQFLERICPKKQAVLRQLVIRELESGPEYWLKSHLSLYEMDEMMEHMAQESFESITYTEEMSIPELMRAQHEMKEYMYELRRDFLNNPELYRLGVYDVTDYRIVSKQTDAYFVQGADHEYVPVGWLRERGGLQNKSLIQKGFEEMRTSAARYMNQFSEKIRAWGRECQVVCQEKQQKRQAPGVLGGFISLLGGVVLMFFCSILSQNYLEGSGVVSKAGFMLTFLAVMLCMAAGVVRLAQYRLWRRMVHSVDNLNDIASEVDRLRKDMELDEIDSVNEISPAAHNLEMEAQAERAYSGYLAIYRKLKNGLLRYYLIFMISFCILGTGLYMDGVISLHGGDVIGQVTSLFQKNDKKESQEGETRASDVFKVSVKSARLRAGAGTSYEILNSYEKGTEVNTTGKSQSDGSHIWYQVITPDGTTGWMRDDMISR